MRGASPGTGEARVTRPREKGFMITRKSPPMRSPSACQLTLLAIGMYMSSGGQPSSPDE